MGALAGVAASLVPVTLYLVAGPSYMRFFATFWLGAATVPVLAAAVGQLRRGDEGCKTPWTHQPRFHGSSRPI
jgi:hypothetical protein